MAVARWQTDERGLHVRRYSPYFVKNACKWRDEKSAGKKVGPDSCGWFNELPRLLTKVKSNKRTLTAGLRVATKLMSLSLCCSNDTAVCHLAVTLLPTAGHRIPCRRTGRRPIFGQTGKYDHNTDGHAHSNITRYSPIWRVNAIFTQCSANSLDKAPTAGPTVTHIIACDTYHITLQLIFAGWVREVKTMLLNLLKTKRIMLYIRNQSVPRSKHFPPRL